jgi:hypothetical protein
VPTLLQAQYGRNPRQQQQQAAMQQPVELQGVLQGMSKGNLVVAANNQRWQVALAPITKVHITGATTGDALRSGTIVEFTAEINDHGAIREKVDALTITSLSQEKQIGLFPSGGAKEDGVVDGFGADAEKDKAKAKGKGKDSVKTTGKSGKRTKPNPRVLPAGSYRIVGRLSVTRNGAFSVQADRTNLAFELADQAKIDVDTADASFVRPGYEVTIHGFQVPNRPGVLRATEVRVKLPEPKVADQPEPAPRHPAKKAAKSPAKGKKKADDEPPPEDGDK